MDCGFLNNLNNADGDIQTVRPRSMQFDNADIPKTKSAIQSSGKSTVNKGIQYNINHFE